MRTHHAQGHGESIAHVDRECEQCGVDITVEKWKVENGHGSFCSQECAEEWLSENHRGENHHCWEGGDASTRE